MKGHGEETDVKNKELVSFNQVVREISSLVELDDKELEQVVGGYADLVADCPTNNACEPNCRCNSNCTNLA